MAKGQGRAISRARPGVYYTCVRPRAPRDRALYVYMALSGVLRRRRRRRMGLALEPRSTQFHYSPGCRVGV